jgi:hypothetical protein
MRKQDCNWWRLYLSPEALQAYEDEPDGRLSRKFHRMFRMSFDIFKRRALDLAVETWWQNWHEDAVDCFNKPNADLRLKLLGAALCTLATAATHFFVSTCTNLSEEVHRSFFNNWIEKMTSIKERFIFFPSDDESLKFVCNEYAQLGLPGCVGSVDCVHVGWSKCPSQHLHLYKGKEGYPSVAYEVVCTPRKFIQSVSQGHPGARNDKHIARTDPAITDLLFGNGWLRSKCWEVTNDALGRRKVLRGLYLICDGGYHSWPCHVYPVKVGNPGSVSMKFSKLVESVRKDIEGVFGILKIRFRFLKIFTNLRRQKHIDYAFVTCCILHNILLEENGYLDANLPDYPGGMASALKLKFSRSRRGGATSQLWLRGYDDTSDDEEEEAERRRPIQEARRFAQEWQTVMQALMNHYQFSSTKNHLLLIGCFLSVSNVVVICVVALIVTCADSSIVSFLLRSISTIIIFGLVTITTGITIFGTIIVRGVMKHNNLHILGKRFWIWQRSQK